MPASILVVEDNEANLILIDYLLRAYGFTPLLARSGAEGLRIALKERPDVVLLDIRMPGMDGYELAASIKRVPALEQMRVVAVTASAMVGDRERIAAAGFDGYIQKPIDPETFMGTLDQLLPALPAARRRLPTQRTRRRRTTMTGRRSPRRRAANRGKGCFPRPRWVGSPGTR